jgi:hypothetical protein
MKHVFFVMCTAIALSIGVARCGNGMSDVRSRAQNSGCEASCQQAKDKCNSKCTSDSTDQAQTTACNLACSESQDKCNSECKNQ